LPIGVPASVLTGNHKWVNYFAKNGFNVLTYKTVRSRVFGSSQSPNWVLVPGESAAWEVSAKDRTVEADPWDWVDPGVAAVTTANSFGVPSLDPREWMADVENALSVIASDQILIVSVMGDDYDSPEPSTRGIAEDFAATALMAESSGADIVELNLSCPNSLDKRQGGVKDPVCLDPELTTAIVETVRERLSSGTRLVAKLSFLDEEPLADLVHRIAPSVDGIAGINTLQCKVHRSVSLDSETFPGRPRAGVSGIAVREYAQDFVMRLARLRAETGKYYEILGMGGVTDPGSFEMLFQMGASAVQTASGAFTNPFLASECVQQLGATLPSEPGLNDPELIDQLQHVILEATRRNPLPIATLAAGMPLRSKQVRELVAAMAEDGIVADKEGVIFAQ
jgi:dihydroorotate dehydrogenase